MIAIANALDFVASNYVGLSIFLQRLPQLTLPHVFFYWKSYLSDTKLCFLRAFPHSLSSLYHHARLCFWSFRYM